MMPHESGVPGGGRYRRPSIAGRLRNHRDGDAEVLDLDPGPFAGGSCWRGGGVVWAFDEDASVSRGEGLLAVLFGDGAAEEFDGGLAVDRVDESDGREELLELEEDEELELAPRLESLAGAGAARNPSSR